MANRLYRELLEFDWFAKHLPVEFHKVVPITLMDASANGHIETPLERKFRMLNQLSITCKSCSMCELGRRLASKNNECRDPHVFSNMKPSKVVVVGQNPGWEEVKKCIPFIGAAGANFDKELCRNGLSRDDVYITNTVKCYSDNNRKPTYEEVSRCAPFLQMELTLLNPSLVVALGAVAFDRLCPGCSFGDSLKKITHSTVYNVKVFAAYHPSPLNLMEPSRRTAFVDQMQVLCSLIKRLKERQLKDTEAPLG